MNLQDAINDIKYCWRKIGIMDDSLISDDRHRATYLWFQEDNERLMIEYTVATPYFAKDIKDIQYKPQTSGSGSWIRIEFESGDEIKIFPGSDGSDIRAQVEKKKNDASQVYNTRFSIKRLFEDEVENQMLGFSGDEEFIIKKNVLYHYNGEGKIVKIPSGVREINPKVFSGNKEIEQVYIPETVRIIGEGAFEDTSNLRVVVFEGDSNLEEIFPDAFSGSGIKSITLPKSITHIYEDAFSYCYNLKTVRGVSLKDVEYVSPYAFSKTPFDKKS